MGKRASILFCQLTTQEISKNTGNTTIQNLTDICKTFHSVTENEHTSKYPWYVYRYTPMSLVTTITIKPELVLYIKIHFGINKHKLIFAVFSVSSIIEESFGNTFNLEVILGVAQLPEARMYAPVVWFPLGQLTTACNYSFRRSDTLFCPEGKFL